MKTTEHPRELGDAEAEAIIDDSMAGRTTS